MNNLSRTITGTFMIVGGLVLSLLPLFLAEEGAFVGLIYGLPIFIIGFFILRNKKEDEIEQIKGGKNE